MLSECDFGLSFRPIGYTRVSIPPVSSVCSGLLFSFINIQKICISPVRYKKQKNLLLTTALYSYIRKMNFLAHIYLSGDDELLRIGNFIADSIKGNKYTMFPKRVQQGILLHRQIDSYTDHHPTVRQSTRRLHANYSHYSGVIVDMYYDHFLAANWGDYSDVPLDVFADEFYTTLENHRDILPERTLGMLPYMKRENWLLSYASLEGLERILTQMNRRTAYKSNMHLAVHDLRAHYTAFQEEFTVFFKELLIFTRAKIREADQ
ncbi:Acyl carrier protein phosphodiesterase [Sinomicrobium oceani]|uniref:Acyl carrier protein phosphodiesterase n=2 Tax=Sinomicrobium oceani TaxID=1150368 RepID=A0A1K1QI08_9FLAO|nr:Acyl carrier protein phosphodiesterase [Sinomicrobium oceani]